MSAKDLFSKCHTLKKKKCFWLQRKRWISSTPHCSLSVFQQRTPLLLHNEMEESIWGFVGWSFPVLPWLSTFNWLALKCSLLKELILALCSVFFTGCACVNLSDPWHCDSCCSIYCDNKTTRGYGTSETEISTRLMKSEKTLIDILP